MKMIGLQIEQLVAPHCQLKHVGGSKLKVVGSHPVHIKHNDQHIEMDMHFAIGIENIYLSLDACKELCIVHKDFPNISISNISVNNITSITD